MGRSGGDLYPVAGVEDMCSAVDLHAELPVQHIEELSCCSMMMPYLRRL